MNGSTAIMLTKGSTPAVSITTMAMKAASTIRSPWAMFTSRITPKMMASPAANSA